MDGIYIYPNIRFSLLNHGVKTERLYWLDMVGIVGSKSKYGGFGHTSIQGIRRVDLVHNALMFQSGGGGHGRSELGENVEEVYLDIVEILLIFIIM